MSELKELDRIAVELSNRLVNAARNSGSEPVVFVSGNCMAPNWRWFDAMERLFWQYADDTACWVWEHVESLCESHDVYVDTGPDGSIYVVDTARFQYQDNDETAETLTDEWELI